MRCWQSFFPDGETIVINWKARRQPTIDVWGVEHYEAMREAALNGDAMLSMGLYELQRGCRERYKTQEELDDAINQLMQTHTFPMPDSDSRGAFGDNTDLEQNAQSMRDDHDRCTKFIRKQGNLDEPWLERAAHDGWHISMIEYGKTLEDTGEAASWFAEAWDSGSHGSLYLLANISKAAYERGECPDAFVEAYAYLHTAVIIDTARLSNGGRIAARHAAAIAEKLENRISNSRDGA